MSRNVQKIVKKFEEAGILKEPSIPTDFSDFLMQGANILEIPSFDEENLQESVQKYKQRMKHLQETNGGLFKVNRGLIEELQDVHHHFLEVSEVSKEVLNKKKTSDRHCKKLEKTVESLQQENEDLQRKILIWKINIKEQRERLKA